MSSDLEHALATLRALPKAERRPAALLVNATFQHAVSLARGARRRGAVRARAPRRPAARKVALEALASRDGDEGPLLLLAPTVSPANAVFLLRALDRRVRDGLVERLLAAAGPAWLKAPLEDLRALVRRRGEVVWLGDVPDERLDAVAELVEQLGDALPSSVAESLEKRAALREIEGGLSPIGRVRRGPDAVEQADALRLDEPLEREVEALARAIASDKPVLVVGERGSGRISRLRAAGARLARDGWMTFEAGAAEVNAGMSYVGELDGRVRYLVGALDDKPVLWIVPEFETLLGAGVYRGNPRGLLDLLLAGMAGTAPAYRRRHRPGRVRAARPGAAGAARRVRRRARAADGRAADAGARGAGGAGNGARGPARGPRRSAVTSSATTRCPARCCRCWRRCAGAAGTTARSSSPTCWPRSPSAPGCRCRCSTSANGSTSTRCARSSPGA